MHTSKYTQKSDEFVLHEDIVIEYDWKSPDGPKIVTFFNKKTFKTIKLVQGPYNEMELFVGPVKKTVNRYVITVKKADVLRDEFTKHFKTHDEAWEAKNVLEEELSSDFTISIDEKEVEE